MDTVVAGARLKEMENVCVYCGSGEGKNPAYGAAADHFGSAIAAAGIGLVYGGGSLGLMGRVARATIKGGGRVTGIIPAFLTEREQMLREANELIVTSDMHQRKMLMFEKSDGFVALPGGIGTLEELVEQLTWVQLGRHEKPVVIANIEGFWTPFLNLLHCMRSDAFIRQSLEVKFHVVDRAEDILPTLLKAAPTAVAPADEARVVAKF
jgi:uncharacterized protein (TIGR00730 family)